MGCCEEQIIQLNYGSQTVKVGPRGPQGVPGIQGPAGESISALGAEGSYAAMVFNHPTPSVLDAYIVQDTSHFWIYDPASGVANIDGWVDMGSLQGPQGIQGIQGIQGLQGVSAYVYAGYWDSTQTNFSYDPTTVVGGVAYMKLLTSTATILPHTLTVGNFVVGGTVNYVTEFIPVGGTSGGSSTSPITPSGTFLSSSIAPSGVATTGDVHLNKATGIYYQYDGTSWNAFPGASFSTDWVSASSLILSGWSAGTGINIPKFKQINKEVIFSGKIYRSLSNIITDVIVFTLPSAYWPLRTQVLNLFNSSSGQFCLGIVFTNGEVWYMGSYFPANTLESILIDSAKYSLL